MSEVLRSFVRGVFAFDAVMQRAPSQGWTNPSPCEGWTARHVADHNVFVANMVANMASGVPATVPAEGLEAAIPAPGGGGRAMNPAILRRFVGRDDDPLAVWGAHRDRLLEALDTKGALQAETASPFGPCTVEQFLAFALHDPVVHAWDLACALGVEHGIAADLAERAARAVQEAEATLKLRQPIVFAAAKPPAGDDPLSRLLALTGRG